MAYLITHITNQELPNSGLSRVSFFTIDTENQNSNEYFLGTDNNAIDIDDIEVMLFKRKIVKLDTQIQIDENEGLFCDEKGNLIKADYQNPSIRQEKIDVKVPELEKKFIDKIVSPHREQLRDFGRKLVNQYDIPLVNNISALVNTISAEE